MDIEYLPKYLHNIFFIYLQVGILNVMPTNILLRFILISLLLYLLLNNSISQMLDLLQFEPLVFPNYAIFSNYNCGYADLPKCLWLCQSVQESSNIYCFCQRYGWKPKISICFWTSPSFLAWNEVCQALWNVPKETSNRKAEQGPNDMTPQTK